MQLQDLQLIEYMQPVGIHIAHHRVKGSQFIIRHVGAVTECDGNLTQRLAHLLPVPGPGGHADQDVFYFHAGILLPAVQKTGAS